MTDQADPEITVQEPPVTIESAQALANEAMAHAANLAAENADLVLKLEAMMADRDTWHAQAESLGRMLDAMRAQSAPVPEPLPEPEPIAAGQADGRCVSLGRHVAACDCTGAARGPIAIVKQRSPDYR